MIFARQQFLFLHLQVNYNFALRESKLNNRSENSSETPPYSPMYYSSYVSRIGMDEIIISRNISRSNMFISMPMRRYSRYSHLENKNLVGFLSRSFQSASFSGLILCAFGFVVSFGT